MTEVFLGRRIFILERIDGALFFDDPYTEEVWRATEARKFKRCPICRALVFPWPSTRVYCGRRCAATAARRRYRAAHKE